jgi:recombinational DNA repair protein RecR
MYDIPSRLVETAIQEISRLPGIGRKTALRLVLHLLRKDTGEALALGQAIIQMREQIVSAVNAIIFLTTNYARYAPILPGMSV